MARSAKRVPKNILDWAFDGPEEFYVSTSYGWAFEPSEDQNVAEHVHIFPTVREAREYVRDNKPRPCTCLRCTSRGQAPGV